MEIKLWKSCLDNNLKNFEDFLDIIWGLLAPFYGSLDNNYILITTKISVFIPIFTPLTYITFSYTNSYTKF